MPTETVNNKSEESVTSDFDIGSEIPFAARMPKDFMSKFGVINKWILRDLSKNQMSDRFYLHTRDEIARYLKDPQGNEKELRDSVIYLYGASSHFRRLIQYFVCLSDLSYVVSPYRIDTATAKPKAVKRNYKKVMDFLSSMNIKNQFEKVLTIVLREDVFYGTIRESSDSTIIQQLPSNYCKIAVIEDNVPNVSFDFSYFNTNRDLLELYPAEFTTKFNAYSNNKAPKIQELDAPNSFAIKCNKDVLNYALPPFAGILREIYDLEDYKQLKMTKTELENYAMLVMTLPMDDDGHELINLSKAKNYYRNMDGVVPEEIGTVLSPMKIEKISFEKTHSGDDNTISEAEQNLFTAAGVQSLLFNNEKASSNAILLSVKSDQSMTYGIVKSIEDMLNRYIHRQTYGKNFKVTFLNCSPFNREELGNSYLKACQYGIPMISYYCASQGLLQDEMDSMNFLEDKVLDIKNRFVPLQSSATLSSKKEDSPTDGERGRPSKGLGEVSDNGEISQERDEG